MRSLDMSYVVYDVETIKILAEKRNGRKAYKTMAAAKAARTRMIEKKLYRAEQLDHMFA